MNSVVRFFKNKNTVTVLGVLLIALILGFGYYYQVQKQVKPISVPVAAVTIQPRTEITSDMITYVEVPEAYISENVVRNEQEIIAKYAQYNTVIPAGSMFYNETLTTKEMLPNYLLSLLKEGEIGLSFKIGEMEGPKPPIMPGEKIDIYMKVTTIGQDIASNALKWELFRTYQGTESFVGRGTFDGVSSGNKIYVDRDYRLSTEETSYTVYIWLDGSLIGNEALGESFIGYIGAEAQHITELK